MNLDDIEPIKLLVIQALDDAALLDALESCRSDIAISPSRNQNGDWCWRSIDQKLYGSPTFRGALRARIAEIETGQRYLWPDVFDMPYGERQKRKKTELANALKRLEELRNELTQAETEIDRLKKENRRFRREIFRYAETTALPEKSSKEL